MSVKVPVHLLVIRETLFVFLDYEGVVPALDNRDISRNIIDADLIHIACSIGKASNAVFVCIGIRVSAYLDDTYPVAAAKEKRD